jgi:uncharacterized membrane protein
VITVSETDKARLALLAAYYKALPAGLVEKIIAIAGALKDKGSQTAGRR